MGRSCGVFGQWQIHFEHEHLCNIPKRVCSNQRHDSFPPFSISHHYLLSTVHYALNRLVHSWPESFFQCGCKGSIDVHLGAFDILKAHTHAATIAALALVKRHFFCRSKRVKIFSETFVTKYLYKGDSNTS